MQANHVKPMPFCANCGKEVPVGNAFCPNCGASTQVPASGTSSQTVPGTQMARKSVLIALILSFIFPGLGQYYAGQKKKALRLIVIAVVLALTVLIEIGVILYPIFWLYSMVDTFLTVRKVNSGLPPN